MPYRFSGRAGRVAAPFQLDPGVVGAVAPDVGRDERAPDDDAELAAGDVGEDRGGELLPKPLPSKSGSISVWRSSIVPSPWRYWLNPASLAPSRASKRRRSGTSTTRSSSGEGESAAGGSTRSARSRTSSRVPPMLWTFWPWSSVAGDDVVLRPGRLPAAGAGGSQGLAACGHGGTSWAPCATRHRFVTVAERLRDAGRHEMATGSGTKDDPWVLKTPPGHVASTRCSATTRPTRRRSSARSAGRS